MYTRSSTHSNPYNGETDGVNNVREETVAKRRHHALLFFAHNKIDTSHCLSQHLSLGTCRREEASPLLDRSIDLEGKYYWKYRTRCGFCLPFSNPRINKVLLWGSRFLPYTSGSKKPKQCNGKRVLTMVEVSSEARRRACPRPQIKLCQPTIWMIWKMSTTMN